MTDSSRLVADASDGVLRVTINRPEKRNALSREVLAALRDAFQRFAASTDLKVAVLRGAGDRCFAAGGDLRDLEAVRTSDDTTRMAEQGRRCLDAVRGFPVPVVGALNGDALGGGAELAAACDFRVASAHARIGFVQGRLNISTAWGGGIDLMRIVGPVAGLRLLARSELLDGAAALAIGLVDAVAAAEQRLDDLVEEFIAPLRAQTPQVLRAFKALAAGARGGLTRAELETLETHAFSGTWVHEDHWAAAARLLSPRR